MGESKGDELLLGSASMGDRINGGDMRSRRELIAEQCKAVALAASALAALHEQTAKCLVDPILTPDENLSQIGVRASKLINVFSEVLSDTDAAVPVPAMVRTVINEAARPMDLTETTDNSLNPAQAAAFLSMPVKTLAHWRLAGGGPHYSKLGRRVVYLRSDLTDFVVSRRVSNTSEARVKLAKARRPA
jgi:hypothetical protein